MQTPDPDPEGNGPVWPASGIRRGLAGSVPEDTERALDWAAIACILAERSDDPLAVLDTAGRVVFVNRSMEAALGWNRFEVERRDWSDLCSTNEKKSDPARWISEAFRGTLREHHTTVQTRSGARVRMDLELSVAGRGSKQALLVVARRVAVERENAAGSRDVDYQISLVRHEFGRVLRLYADGETVSLPHPNARCFTLMHGLDQPCEDCPALCARSGETIRYRETDESQFELVRAEHVDESTMRVRVRVISDTTLSALYQAKLEQLAERAKLSHRERDVVKYLLLGRTIDDIAGILQISPRTVKYHQANVLEKLGADSRVDLLRLII